MFRKYSVIGLYLIVSVVSAQQADRVKLGSLQIDATVSFVRSSEGLWGIEISGGASPGMLQQQPAQVEIYRSQDNVQQLA